MNVRKLGIHESVGTLFPPEKLAETLADVEPDVSVVGDDDLDGVDAVVTFDYSEAFLGAVDWVHVVLAGVDTFPVEVFERRGVVLTNSTGIHGTAVGETVAGMMLMFARRLHALVRNQVAHEWEQPGWAEPTTLRDQRLCVVGLGTLGRGIAAHADALGMKVTGVKRHPADVEGVREVYPPDELHEAIDDVDFVTLAVPLTDETEGLFGGPEFERMQTEAYLINVSRGPVVREDELVTALRDGDIAGAGLDVFETEPLPAESPLWDLPEVVVTPHCSALHRQYYRDVADLVRQNLVHLSAGEDMVNRVV